MMGIYIYIFDENKQGMWLLYRNKLDKSLRKLVTGGWGGGGGLKIGESGEGDHLHCLMVESMCQKLNVRSVRKAELVFSYFRGGEDTC